MLQQSEQIGDNSHNGGGSEKTTLFAGTHCLVANLHNQWIIDSGASDHMCHNLDLFSEYKLLDSDEHMITIPNGKKVTMRCVGSVKLQNGIVLKKVLFVPDFQFNLISVQRLSYELNCDVTFTHNACYIQGPLKKDSWTLGKARQGLYYY